jgi:DNA-binding transcriptional ArsR family regulator
VSNSGNLSSAGGDVTAVTSVQTLRALADPLRLAILGALMRDAPRDLRVMSAKELASELSEPQTKLYRHIKQLEAAGLIRAASSRVVSGITEQRYQACQRDLSFGPDLLRGQATADDSAALVAALFDRYRGGFLAHQRAQRAAGEPAPQEAYRRPVLTFTGSNVSAAKAKRIRGLVQQVIDALDEPETETTEPTVPIEVLISFYSPGTPEAGPAE